MREYHAAGLILCPAFDTPEAVLEAMRAWGIPLLVVVRPVRDGTLRLRRLGQRGRDVCWRRSI